MTSTTPEFRQADVTMDERLAGREVGTPPLPPFRALPAGPRRLTGPVLGQLVAVEAAVFAVAVVVGHRPWVVVLVAALALITVALLLGRWRGRWWYQQLSLLIRYQRELRRARRPGVDEPDPRRAALRELVPELRIVDAGLDDRTFGVGYDGVGWFAALVIDPSDVPLPMAALAELADGGLSRIQVVTHTVPAVVARLNAWAPVVASYVDVSAKLTGPVPPGQTTTYLVVRLDAGDAVAVTGGRGGTAGVRAALDAGLRDAAVALSTVDIKGRALDSDELHTALAASLGFGPVPTIPAGQRRARAHWDRLSVDGYPQACFQVTGWPPHGDRLSAMLAAIPAAWTDLSLILGPRTDRLGPDEVALRAHLRVAAEPDALGSVCAALTAAAGLQNVTLRRLDGEHDAAAYTTAPTGGLPRVGAPGHACPRTALDKIAAPVGRGGVLLGRDPDHRPVMVPLFGHRPLRLLLSGGIWPSRVVLLRCLAVGARVVAAPGQPDWVSLGRWATGTDNWVAPPGSPLPPPHPAAPVLVGRDAGATMPPAGWQSAVTTCARPSAALLAGVDLMITARLLPADAELVAARFGIDEESARLLPRMYDDMVAVIEPGRVRYAWPMPSAAEQEILAPPRQLPPGLAPGW